MYYAKERNGMDIHIKGQRMKHAWLVSKLSSVLHFATEKIAKFFFALLD